MTIALLPVGTKAAVPRLPAPWNRRQRLNDRCSRVRPGEAMLVAGFAGAGKTTLLADWFTNDCAAPGRACYGLEGQEPPRARFCSNGAPVAGGSILVVGLDSRSR